jgi:CRISPR-associated protein Csm2
LLDSEARERAKELRGVASSQLYRFYATAVAFKQRLQIDQQVTDGEVEAQIAYLKASSAYSGARRQAKEQAKALPLVEFFAAAANSVRTREDYIGFTRHFEAIMAFHKVFEEKRTDG